MATTDMFEFPPFPAFQTSFSYNQKVSIKKNLKSVRKDKTFNSLIVIFEISMPKKTELWPKKIKQSSDQVVQELKPVVVVVVAGL